MKSLSEKLVEIVKSSMSGKRLENFEKSVSIINTSLALGGWVKGGSRSADSGFYQGLFKVPFNFEYEGNKISSQVWNEMNDFVRVLSYGSQLRKEIDIENCIKLMRNGTDRHSGKKLKIKVSDGTIRAWIVLSQEKVMAINWLNSSRPVPVITDMGTSPKVLRTLKEMNLTMTVSTLKYPKVERKEKEYTYIDRISGEIKTKNHVYYDIVWEEGIKHNQSRFSGRSYNGHITCQACGKAIPSGMLVPFEGKDVNGQWLSILVGTDCAKSLFGATDVGIDHDVDRTIEKAKNEAKKAREYYMKKVGRDDIRS